MMDRLLVEFTVLESFFKLAREEGRGAREKEERKKPVEKGKQAPNRPAELAQKASFFVYKGGVGVAAAAGPYLRPRCERRKES